MTMSNEMWVVVFLDQEPLAFPATLIKEVVPWQPLNPVPSTALGVMGLVSLRGETLAVLDLLRMTGHGQLDDPQFMLIVDFPEARMGLAVARVEGVQYFNAQDADTNMAGGYVQATVERDGRLYQLINPHGLEHLIGQHTDVGALVRDF